ncbi:Isochorismatase (modular protein) [Nostocoides japonicum T1-X7]|uniref:isochorismatase n=1 Tax=Nostocoides japonicum T1-X7 TaxID=1194083 RepID=A0A077LV68_9MICO|nr:isochorismatase family protein [Tetrasphaera japonica]CCH76642.1 Isochorismatase (modular protein) [Tetrasphaera japonica T1-X7]
MPLPHLIDYPAPLTDLPESQATWSLEPERAAVLVHDLQRYFLRPFAPGSPVVEAMLTHTAAILRAARSAGIPVLYTAQDGDQDPAERGLQGDLWGRGMRADPEHTAIVDEVAPTGSDTVLPKHRYSAFARSDLADRLGRAGRGQLVITGVYAHIGILATVFDAFQREVQPFVVADAVADFGAAEHRRALCQVASCCGVVTTTDDVLARFGRPADVDGVDETDPWDARIRAALGGLLAGDAIEELFARPDADAFELGLDSLRAFEFLDLLADEGLDVDFGEFTRTPTLDWLRRQARSVGV